MNDDMDGRAGSNGYAGSNGRGEPGRSAPVPAWPELPDPSVQRYGAMLCGALVPVVLVGILATLSISGAIGGIPVLIAAGRPCRIGLRVALGVRRPETFTKNERIHLAACPAFLAVACAVVAVSAIDDLDSGQDVIVWAVLLVDLVSLGVATVGLLRSALPPRIAAAGLEGE